jgi:hypothetical protein
MSRLSERVAALEDRFTIEPILPPLRNPEEAAAFFAEIAKRPCAPPRKLTEAEQRKEAELDQWYYKSIGVTK